MEPAVTSSTSGGETRSMMLASALYYARRGWAVFPLRPRSKVPCTQHGVHDATTDADQIRVWWQQRWPNANIGLACGPASGVDVLDVDGEEGEQSLYELEVVYGVLPGLTLESRTARGRHLFFVHDERARNSASRLGRRLDTRSDGGYVVAPPSIHPSGEVYRWTEGRGPRDLDEPAAWPSWAIELLGARCAEATLETGSAGPEPAALTEDERARRYCVAALEREADELAAMPLGGRNDALAKSAFKLGGYVARGALAEHEVRAALERACTSWPAKERDPRKDRDTLSRALTAGMREPRAIPDPRPHAARPAPYEGPLVLGDDAPAQPPPSSAAPDDGCGEGAPKPGTAYTDLGNAERYVAQHGDDLRYCRALGGWYVWTGSHWTRDETREAERRAHVTARRFYAEVARIASEVARARTPEEQKRLEAILEAATSWAKRSEASQRLAAMVGEARSIAPMPVAHAQFDAEHTRMLLNCPNGTLDLSTGDLRPHRREDLVTKVVSVAYDPAACAPGFEAFLAEILPDAEVRAFVQRWAGYAATGVIRDHLLPVWYGDGANGKGTLGELLKRILGRYAVSCPEGFFEEQKHQKHETEIARLRGARLAIGSETQASSALAEAKIKRLTGGDTLTGRFMREDFFDFDPTAKFVLATNYKPRIKGGDGGIRRRVVLIPFTVTIPEERRDPDLGERLFRTEGAGILRWIIDGAREWMARGQRLEPPDSIRAATEEYLGDEDVIGRFLEEACTVTRADDRSLRCEPAHLFGAFRAWCEKSGDQPGTLRSFSSALAQRGWHATKSNGKRWFHGIAPQAQEHDQRREYYDD